MPFIWSTNPNIPAAIPAPVIGPDEVSFDVHVVANTVNVHGLVLGTLSYNTANKGYDVIYELPSLNVRNLRAQTLTATRATINTALINTATINTATINTANISTATIANGMMGVHPVQNLQIATKEYVDALMANSVPLGGNLQLLIITAGDLLVGVADNTAARFPVGSINGSVLVSGNSSNVVGVHWRPQVEDGHVGSFRGLVIGTDTHGSSKNTQVQLVSVDEIIMDDGQRISSGWDGLTGSISANGAPGFLDTGVVLANTWYEVWAIRDSANGDQGLLLHRALDRTIDASTEILISDPAVERKVLFVNAGDAINVVNISQSFIPGKSGPLVCVDLSVVRVGQPVGNCWITLEANNSVGNASGTPLATSRYIDVGRLPVSNLSPTAARFVFDTTSNVVSGNSYHCVYHVDYVPAGFGAEHYTIIRGYSNVIAGTYTNGLSKNFSANTNSWEVSNSGAAYNTPVGPGDLYMRTYVESNNSTIILPTGYDQKCLVSYTRTDRLSQLKEYSQRQRRIVTSFINEWREPSYGAGLRTFDRYSVCVDTANVTPPVICIVQFTITGWSSALAAGGIGHISSTDIGGSIPGAGCVVFETEGAVYANAGFSAGITTFAPVLVETQAVQVQLGTAANLYATTVDF